MQRRLVQTKVATRFFYSVWKEATHKPLKINAAKNPFSSLFFIDTIRFDECFVFYVILEDIIFIKVYPSSEVFLTAMLFLSLNKVF